MIPTPTSEAVLSDAEIDDWIVTIAHGSILGTSINGRENIHRFARAVVKQALKNLAAPVAGGQAGVVAYRKGFMNGLSWMRANRDDPAYDHPSEWKQAADASASRFEAVAQPTEGQSADRMAYEGAREDLLHWKRRALEAEAQVRNFVREVNGPTFMGEPATPTEGAAEPASDVGLWRNHVENIVDAWTDLRRPRDERHYTASLLDTVVGQAALDLAATPTDGAGGDVAKDWTPEDFEAVICCLDDDAAAMLDENDEDERARNMQTAASMIQFLLLVTPVRVIEAYEAGFWKFSEDGDICMEALRECAEEYAAMSAAPSVAKDGHTAATQCEHDWSVAAPDLLAVLRIIVGKHYMGACRLSPADLERAEAVIAKATRRAIARAAAAISTGEQGVDAARSTGGEGSLG